MAAEARHLGEVGRAGWRVGEVFRPDPSLLTAYLIVSLLTGPGFFLAFPVYFIRYKTLRYRLDDEGVWMAVGWLWRKENTITYRRMQDVQLARGLVQRWVGISTVSVQTAAGSATPDVMLEGVRDGDGLRDFLYSRMRGGVREAEAAAAGGASAVEDEALVLLREIRDALRDRSSAGGPR